MPELPEVETTRRGLHDHCVGLPVTAVVLRERRLRWPVPADLPQCLQGQVLRALTRRAKYLCFEFDHGTLLVHLGMSGSLRVLMQPQEPARHDHIDLQFGPITLRYNDPRRFGSFQWFAHGAELTPLAKLGPEPLSPDFSGRRLYELSRGRRVAVKPFIMDGETVVGVGNIYAAESLYLAGIRPDRAAGRVSLARYENLAAAIKQVLTNAIESGGTTLRDFVGGDGKPGYFAQKLHVYGRGSLPCPGCGRPLAEKTIGQRASVYCIACQR